MPTIDQLLEIEKQMTEGPWEARDTNALSQWNVYPPKHVKRSLFFTDGITKAGPEEPQHYAIEHCKQNIEGIAAMRNAFPALLRVAKAAKTRIENGCNDTCSKALVDRYDCDCGQEELMQALSDLEGGNE